MYKIVRKELLNPTICLLEVEAPFVARKAQPGQFIILRIDEKGERLPLTIGGFDRERGTITIIFQLVGLTTRALAKMEEGDALLDFVGPLGQPTEMEGLKSACVIGGGLGTAIAYPVAKGLHDAGVETDVIVGFRNKDLVILEQEFADACDHFYLMTDDGSYGEKGFTTAKEKELLEGGKHYDVIIAIGPVPMMKFVVRTAEPFGTPCRVSLNPIMIDGTGMCGGCRVSVGGQMKFACVDGPEFDGYQVDFDELMNRNATYRTQESEKERDHMCRFDKLGQELIR
ncbi:MAG: sulfide/dihydroorotate dehydrogenase-like FAD/NAD-binding protein [Clostridiales bacterium]|nr:sulfide/dihydroorotate dehydrogenase-like FAD/NAD-binding protein [Clostridiales bacterium]